MGNYISKNHRIGTAQRLAESIGEEWYGFIASPEKAEPVRGENATDEVSLDKLSRQILVHAKITDDGFALMANYTPNATENGLIALNTLSYYGDGEDDGNDVVIDYNQVDIRVYKILYKDIQGSVGDYIKISDFATSSDTDEFQVYDVDEVPKAGTKVNIKYQYIGRINSDVLGNFYLREENIFPVRFDLINKPSNSNPGGVEWITKNGDITFDKTKDEYTGITDGVYPAILNGDGVSGKVEVTLDGSGYVDTIKVVDAGRNFKDATKLKLSYTDNTDIEVDAITADPRTNYFTFAKISPVEGHGIKHTDDEFEMAKQFSFVGLKFYAKLSAGDINKNISANTKFRTTGLFRKRKDETDINIRHITCNQLIAGELYKRTDDDVSAGVTFTAKGNDVTITYTDDNYHITKNIYIKVNDKIFRVKGDVTGVAEKTLTIDNSAGLLTFDSSEAIERGITSFTVLEAKGVAISGNNLLVLPNGEGVYQSFRLGSDKVMGIDTTSHITQVSEINDGDIYSDIMSFDTVDEADIHTWKTGNNIYFSQIILL